MSQLNLKSLVGKLNRVCQSSLEGAAGLCLSRTNYNVEPEHWLRKFVEMPDTDFSAICRFYGVSVDRLQADLDRVIDGLKRGNARPPALSEQIVDLMREGYLAATIEFGRSTVRSGHLIYALVGTDSLSRMAKEASEEFEKISPEALKRDMPDIIADTAESKGVEESRPTAPGERAAPTGGSGALEQFTIDLTARAENGELDPVLGRDREIRQIIDILMRRRQNNPILTGEAGVGKTAVVEGFALRIAAGDVPEVLENVRVRSLDLALLQAGAGMKGEFENRLRGVIDEVKGSPVPIILFIDEAHTLIGAGGQAGQGDAANLLKPALARGELRTIAATTWAEYKKYFEKDAALARRFQVVKVEEPSEASAMEMMRGIVNMLESHHEVRILEEAVADAVKLSHRYISGRQLPDKAVSLLDTACARVAIGQASTPPALEACLRRIDQLAVEERILRREAAAGADHADRIAELQQLRADAETERDELTQRWDQEKELVGRIREIRTKLEELSESASASTSSNGNPSAEADEAPNTDADHDSEALRAELAKHSRVLRDLQGETPLLEPCVDRNTIAAVVSSWTGIPVGRMVSDEVKTVLGLRDLLEERIIGQSHALESISQTIRTARANLTDPRKPLGVFLLVGSSGVGKTETAIALADLLYGGDQNMTTINMSEFKEEHKVSLLMGSPPGYVGYGEGGILTEAVRRKPYSILLLDEMEKAHPGVQDIFYQVFDKGIMRDGEGRDIDFKNTVILMTSNAATDLITSLCADPDTIPEPDAFIEAIYPELLKTFKPAFLGRVTVLPYYPLSDDVMRKIIRIQLNRIADRLKASYKAGFTYDDDVVASIASRCHEVQTGARNVDHILTRTLLPELSAELLSRFGDETPVAGVHVGMSDSGSFSYTLT